MRDRISNSKKEGRSLFVDGKRWLVYELSSPYDRRGSSLVFECEDVVRRVREYPRHWLELPDAELARVMEGP